MHRSRFPECELYRPRIPRAVRSPHRGIWNPGSVPLVNSQNALRSHSTTCSVVETLTCLVICPSRLLRYVFATTRPRCFSSLVGASSRGELESVEEAVSRRFHHSYWRKWLSPVFRRKQSIVLGTRFSHRLIGQTRTRPGGTGTRCRTASLVAVSTDYRFTTQFLVSRRLQSKTTATGMTLSMNVAVLTEWVTTELLEIFRLDVELFSALCAGNVGRAHANGIV